MDISFDKRYKSLTPFTISDVPRLVVLTGPNGCGKTHFPELCEYSIANRERPNDNCISGLDGYIGRDVLRLTSEWDRLNNPAAVGFDAVQKHNKSFWHQFRSYARTDESERSRSYLCIHFDALCVQLGKEAENITEDEFVTGFDTSIPAAQNQVFNESISHSFMNYRILQMESAESGRELSAQPPWNLLREILSTAGLPFAFSDPSGQSVRGEYQFRLRHTEFDTEIQFTDLSSGERVLLSLAFWLFHVSRTGSFPKLLLLDEPDAHLHPEMCGHFLKVVHDVLVLQEEVQVIITTHNPTTVALAPPDALYEMFSSGERIRKAESKEAVTRRLSGGLLSVSKTSTVVIVEDEDDERFYQSCFRLLHRGTLDTPECGLLNDAHWLQFTQASLPRRNPSRSQSSGGCCEVEKWVGRLREANLHCIVGLVDHDYKNDAGECVFLLNRHSLENYLVDPLVVYAVLASQSQAPDVAGVPEIAKERVHEIAALDQSHLQAIADSILSLIERQLVDTNRAELDRSSWEVGFMQGVTLNYPLWLRDTRGKDLLDACHSVFDGRFVNRKKLASMFLTLMLVPNDLIQKFREIQGRDSSEAALE